MVALRVVLSGVSHWHAQLHLRAFRAAGANIVGVSDRNSVVLSGFAPEVDCRRDADLEALVGVTSPDFVMVMGRPLEMLEDALSLARAGVAFGVEKPVGISSRDSARLVQAVEEAGVFATVPLVNRYSRVWQLLGDGERPVTPVHAHFLIVNGRPSRYQGAGVGWVMESAIAGGGVMRNLGIHAADAFLRFCGKVPYRFLGARVVRSGSTVGEHYGVAIVEAQGGVVATLEAGYTYPTLGSSGDFAWRMATTDSYVVDRGADIQVAREGTDAAERFPNITQQERYFAFAADVVERLHRGAAPSVTIQDAHDAMALIDRFYAELDRVQFASGSPA